MAAKLMAGFWRCMLSIPPSLWEKQIGKQKRKIRRELGFMTEEHRAVHHFIVRELPKLAEPISPELAAQKLSMPVERAQQVFDDLEQHMTFICRNEEAMAVWAYPVTVQKTPHRLTFSTGERIYAA
ncbi:MAG: hypothetical protein C4520_04495 [Candidatus Abyssobacteria bacterium SURF_5]|uniref:Uncharacterized protein n=1 Tax=Abyssobacteria bacterium (strain SURF_5) TaxID=2093360 RepID=A0A3A4NUZ4_ABYX5|nr:MAG: hypothetical protein C4520_04495 [Candidatus Abyssubacteria bacterium SURF_5]